MPYFRIWRNLSQDLSDTPRKGERDRVSARKICCVPIHFCQRQNFFQHGIPRAISMMLQHFQRLRHPRSRVSSKKWDVTRCIEKKVRLAKLDVSTSQSRIVAGPVELQPARAQRNEILSWNQFARVLESQ